MKRKCQKYRNQTDRSRNIRRGHHRQWRRLRAMMIREQLTAAGNVTQTFVQALPDLKPGDVRSASRIRKALEQTLSTHGIKQDAEFRIALLDLVIERGYLCAAEQGRYRIRHAMCDAANGLPVAA